jgi:drug/metabolite transporter (DMT)-like permease
VPPCTALLGWWLFGEVFTPGMALGLALAAAGVALVTGTRRDNVPTVPIEPGVKP